jgi:hypothetical protein
VAERTCTVDGKVVVLPKNIYVAGNRWVVNRKHRKAYFPIGDTSVKTLGQAVKHLCKLLAEEARQEEGDARMYECRHQRDGCVYYNFQVSSKDLNVSNSVYIGSEATADANRVAAKIKAALILAQLTKQSKHYRARNLLNQKKALTTFMEELL